jgi:NEDD4-binding protein 2
MKQLVIFRGPSGSGKSTAARQFLRDQNLGHEGTMQHFEADRFFLNQEHEYCFDASKLGSAHKWCQHRVRENMEIGVTPIVVSNTSMTKWEVNPYLQLAKEFGYEVVVFKIKGPWNAKLFSERNLHGVPLSVVQKQIDKYQPIEGETEYE